QFNALSAYLGCTPTCHYLVLMGGACKFTADLVSLHGPEIEKLPRMTGERENPVRSTITSGSNPRVSFAVDSTVLGMAPDYDRRCPVQDLSTTPFALHHKDECLLLLSPSEASPPNAKRAIPRHRKAQQWLEGDWSDDEESAADFSGHAHPRRRPRPNFTGVWRRSHVEGYEELLRFSGMDAAAAASAAAAVSLHTIDQDGDNFRLVIQNGRTKLDSRYVIDHSCDGGTAPAAAAAAATRRRPGGGGGRPAVVLYWGDGTGDGIEDQLVLSNVDFAGGKE
ncbi:unnamed protein product, partial [Phaeothamnion confervicola]